MRLDEGLTRAMAVLFVAGALLGTLAVNMLADQEAARAGILSEYFLRQYKYLEFETGSLFLYILERRIKWLLLLWVLGMTVLGSAAVFLYVLWAGFSAGTLLGVAVLRLGLPGLAFCGAAVFPQIFLYIPMWVYFLQCVSGYGNTAGGGRHLSQYFLILAAACAVLCLGIFLESSVNPWVIRQVLKII